ncbi:hypothetical protein RSOLAG1IB_11950 [Rhizoctonia solani AG-1 IB]|uniref:Uncharacterized protein n=1 Tax=Thanatephorus cucumeris (strain AG1-IB / isolate 7/3/14) TaxID=1108050 RepID=A0A0B7FJS1_THACB|nr:hypothetical protein RSOLAG1IB_11950 [Rhizoctonia solani AG-1 IB]
MDCPSTVGQFSSDFPCFLPYEGKAALSTPSRQAGRLSNLEIVNGCYLTHHRLHIVSYSSTASVRVLASQPRNVFGNSSS